ncbi:MAG: SprB repeat-containing protein [Ruminococcus sp.]|nr:SprB repeat-containing protein [Ruminococcus sp.]
MVKSFKITEQPHFFLNTITVDVTGGVAPYTYEWFSSGSH